MVAAVAVGLNPFVAALLLVALAAPADHVSGGTRPGAAPAGAAAAVVLLDPGLPSRSGGALLAGRLRQVGAVEEVGAHGEADDEHARRMAAGGRRRAEWAPP